MMARLFFATFWLIFFVGAIRKWMFPSMNILYLLQDVPIGLAYLYAFWAGFVRRSVLLWGCVLLAALVMLQAFSQMLILELSPVVILVGLHHYLFYIPMMLVFPLALEDFYRRKFILWNLLLVIPVSVLAAFQTTSPKDAFINLTAGGEAMSAGVDVIRATGTFNFTIGYAIWTAIAASMVIGEWLQPQGERVIQSRVLLALSTFCAFLCFLVSGERTAILLSALAVMGGILAAILKGSKRSLMIIGAGIVAIPLFVGATAIIAPQEYVVITDRFTSDRNVDEAQGRTMTLATGFLVQPPVSLLGAGIGMGIDAAHPGDPMANVYTYKYSEYDTIRIVMEAGSVVGLLYVAARIFFGLGMIFLAVVVVRRNGSPHVLPLAMAMFAQCYLLDLTRFGPATFAQVALAYAFVFGAEISSRRQVELQPDAMFNQTRFA